MPIILSPLDQIIFSQGDNWILKNYGPYQELNEYEFGNSDPLSITSAGITYYFTSDPDVIFPEEAEYILLTSKLPKRKSFEDGSLRVKRWLKNPVFRDITPEAITDSWQGNFKFIKEDLNRNIEGLRPPQLGALFAILAHSEYADDRGIIVMPTGTGKTEVMLSALVSIPCDKLLITVPSSELRTQLATKFRTLGLLRRFGLIPKNAHNPIVGIMANRIPNRDHLEHFIAGCNVIVTTMPLVCGYSDEFKMLIGARISHLFVDEAHHSEADTWRDFISGVNFKKVFLFTATPFRSDDRRLQGKFIFNFPLRAAQEQKYYKTINYLPIREYDTQKSDEKIAKKAVQQLRKDRQANFPHILMVRCGNKKRAKEVAAFYEAHGDFRTVVVYTGAPSLKEKIRDIKRKIYDIIICVDMLGEGFDLPELKIAAIHDERQSIPITLQFVGRFTRTSFDNLGEASFIANVAYPPIQNELDRLYAHDSDWNLLLPTIAEGATEKQINFKEFLDGFSGLENSVIPFQNIRPALSTVIYINGGTEWDPSKWTDGILRLDEYEHQFHRVNAADRTIVIILGRINRVDWGNFDTVRNMQWDMIVIYWDYRPNINRVRVNFSMDNFNSGKLVEAVFGEENEVIRGMNVFRIFHEVKRLSIYNFGGRPGSGGDISFRSFFGRGIQDGLSLLEQGTLIKNNIFGAGYKNGEKVTLGCSVSGKVWSYERGNLQELTEWCERIGDIITDDSIDPDIVLQHTLSPKIITSRPEIMPIAIDWHPSIYGRPESGFTITISNAIHDLSNIELNIVNVAIDAPMRFSTDTEFTSSVFQLTLGEHEVGDKHEPFFEITHVEGPEATISYGTTENESLVDFFVKKGPILWFADGSQLMQNLYVTMREHPGRIPLDNIIADNWPGVNLRKESQGIAPYEKDSIQFNFISKVIDDFEIVYDDDGKGEIADVIGINDHPTHIDAHLYHLKFSLNGEVGNLIDNLYQVCGQAQKSLNWKYRKGREFFNHLLRRIEKTKNGNTCSKLIKGKETDLEKLLNAAKWEKEMRLYIYIVQPGFNKAAASDDILLLLGSAYHYLATVGNVDLKVISS